MPFSTACSTPLSNFEAGQNYKDTQDPSGELPIFLMNNAENKRLRKSVKFSDHNNALPLVMFPIKRLFNHTDLFFVMAECSGGEFPPGGGK